MSHRIVRKLSRLEALEALLGLGLLLWGVSAFSRPAAACVAAPDTTIDHEDAARTGASVTRTPVTGDVAHYTFTVRVGDGPNAILRVHRVVRERIAGIPRSTPDAIVLLHGDFSSFATNFMPGDGGLALYLAQADIDVWGFDRRWATAPADEPGPGLPRIAIQTWSAPVRRRPEYRNRDHRARNPRWCRSCYRPRFGECLPCSTSRTGRNRRRASAYRSTRRPG